MYHDHENGAVTILDFVEGPCFLGEMELLGVQKVTSGVTARTDCAGWMIRLEECREEMLNDPVFLRQLCIFSNEKAIRVTSTAACNQMYPLKNRLATFLLQSQRQGLYCEPHTQTAAYLGVSYRHLLSVLSDFRQRRAAAQDPGRGMRFSAPRVWRPCGSRTPFNCDRLPLTGEEIKSIICHTNHTFWRDCHERTRGDPCLTVTVGAKGQL